MILHFQINGQPRDYLRGCTTWIDVDETEDFLFQAAKPGFLLGSFGHTIYLSEEVYEG